MCPPGSSSEELTLGGLVVRLDPLVDVAELAEAGLLVLAVGANERSVEGRGDRLELGAGEALVGDAELTTGEQPVTAGALSLSFSWEPPAA